MENKCPLCGKVNPQTEWACESCGARLPMAPTAQVRRAPVAIDVTPQKPPLAKRPVTAIQIVGALMATAIIVVWPLQCIFDPVKRDAAISPMTTAVTATPAPTPIKSAPQKVFLAPTHVAAHATSAPTLIPTATPFPTSTQVPTPVPMVQEAPTQAAAAAGPRVWVNDKTGVYHYEGTRWFGNTAEGHYTTEAQARADGDRPAENGQ